MSLCRRYTHLKPRKLIKILKWKHERQALLPRLGWKAATLMACAPQARWFGGQEMGGDNQHCHSKTQGQMSLPNRELPSFFVSQSRMKHHLFWGDSLKQPRSLNSHNQIFATGRGTSLFFLKNIFKAFHLKNNGLPGFGLKSYSQTISLLNCYCFH